MCVSNNMVMCTGGSFEGGHVLSCRNCGCVICPNGLALRDALKDRITESVLESLLPYLRSLSTLFKGLQYGDTVHINIEVVKEGVLQGSCLNPVFLLIYINSECNLEIQGEIFLLADDTADSGCSDCTAAEID